MDKKIRSEKYHSGIIKMKYIFLFFLILSVFFYAFPKTLSGAAIDTTNLALTATVSTSFVSAWETLTAVNDGYDPEGSADYSHGAYGNWAGEDAYNQYNWVQYEWTLAKQLTSTSVYWWDDGLGIDQPTEAYIEYWNGTSWMLADSIGTELDKYNSLKLKMMTSRIRIYMKSTMATGILEWRVFGVEGGPCDPTQVVPNVRINDGPVQQTNTANIMAGDSVSFLPYPEDGGYWSWSGPSGFSSTAREITLRDAGADQSGTYTVCHINDCGAATTCHFHLTVRTSDDFSATFTWPEYDPTLSYDFRDEYPELTEPALILDDCEGVVGTQSSGWWTFRWGATANPLVTSAAITPMLERMNYDFAYFRNEMGWPPDKRAKNGYKSAIYLYGSGLCTDDASNTETGGWQSSIYYEGEHWPMVLISYYPVYCFNPSCPYSDREFQMGAVVHEGIHSILADLPGCRNAAWFHEGGNTWLQQEAYARQSGIYSSMGFLNGPSFLAPFMPIECYSGWLHDNSFGGPSAEGVNMYQNGTQICTWRNLLGGVQYSNIFPTFLGMTLGQGSIPWIWRYCESRVLEGMAEGLGESQMRRLITEYRAKQALVDMGEWTGAIIDLLDSQFGIPVKAEWSPSWLNPDTWIATPYVKTTNNGGGLLTPEYRTTPGWSGANQIPLVVSGEVVTVNFQPIGPNMTCQLCYRTRDGKTVYSNPVYGGDCSLDLDLEPANNVVFAVISNTDYIYHGEETRKAHFDYRLQLVEGVLGTADIYKRFYDWTNYISKPLAIEMISSGPELILYPNPVCSGYVLNIDFTVAPREPVEVRIISLTGHVVWNMKINDDISINTDDLPGPGIYLATFSTGSDSSVHKLVVK
ncbi:MAG: T9SS type A sorting domain-containing protein [Bacteroidales bacterium]|nr:T9SS type A sorting domain-containing protein [Bacteroidales bacterium]